MGSGSRTSLHGTVVLTWTVARVSRSLGLPTPRPAVTTESGTVDWAWAEARPLLG